MTETRTVRVMLVDDHADFRNLVAAWLDREPDLSVVAQAGSLEEARRQLRRWGAMLRSWTGDFPTVSDRT